MTSRFSRALWALGMSVLLAGSAEAQRKSGDVNNDGNVSSVDALAVLNAVVGLPAATGHTPSWGDANCDGQVTSVDAAIILAFTVQLDVSQFCVNKIPTAVVTVVTVEAGTGQVVAGGTLQLSAVPRDEANAPITGRTATWTTSDATRATVSSAGVVTGVGAGEVTITATVDGKTGSTVITVLAASNVATLEVSPRTTTVLKDSSVTLTAVVRDAAGNPISGRTFTWTVEKSTIVEVSTAGVVKALALGTSKVYATSQTQKDSATITVTATGATATRTWTGATSTEWGVAGNWSPANIPVATDTVYIPAAPTNQPEIKTTSVTIAGLVVQTGAKVNVGTNELQVTGRADVDGEVLGTGRLTMQGVQARESYLRGKLPNLKIVGTTIIVGATTITGDLELSSSSIFDVNGFLVKVSGNALLRAGLRMRSTLATLDVDGSARFFNDGNTSDAVLSAGTLKVAGNFHVVVPGIAANPFTPFGTHKTVLDGAAPQFVRDSGLVVAEFQELDVSNTTGGVVFEAADTARFRVKGRMSVLTGTTISGNGRVNVMQNFTQAAGGGLTLRNLAVARSFTSGAGFKPDTLTIIGAQSLPAGTAYDYQTVVAAHLATLSGTTSIAKSLIIGCVTLYSDCTLSGGVNVNGQKVTVAGDVRQGRLSSGALTMTKTTDSVVVRGSLLGPVGLTTGATEFSSSDSWTAGILRVGGEFRARGTGASGTHLVILDGTASQSLRIISGFSFQAFTISNTGGVVMNDTTTAVMTSAGRLRTVAVKGDFNITTPVKLTGTGRIDVAGNVQTATGSGVEVGAISIGSTLQAAGSFTPDTAEFNNPGTAQTIQNLPDYNNVLVRGKAAFGGSMTFKGSLIVLSGAELNVESRHVTVTKNLVVNGILRMQDARDTITVLGDSAIFGARNDPAVKNYATAGVLRVSGKLKSDSTGFYPTGSHKTVFTPKSASSINVKTASGVFHNFEIAAVNTNTAPANAARVYLTNVVVRGAMVATSGAAPIQMDTVTVDGAATLTQNDTIFVTASSLAGSPVITKFNGDVTVKKFYLSGVGTEVKGNLTLVDGALLVGYVLYQGTYKEEGTVLSPELNKATLKGIFGVRYIQTPTTTKVGTPFNPVVTVEILSAANTRLTGTAVVYITPTTNYTGPTRVVTVDGIGTFTGLTPTTQVGTRTLQIRVRQNINQEVATTSASYTVDP